MRNLLQRDDIHEFKPMLAEIEEAPVSPLGRLMFWLIVSIFLFFAVWLTVGQIDVVVSSLAAKVIPEGQVKIVQPLDTGIISRILVKEGQYVVKGQQLMEIDPSSVQPEVESTRKNLNYAKLEGRRLSATANGSPFRVSGNEGDRDSLLTQKQLYAASLENLSNQINSKEEELKKTDEEIKSTEVDIADSRQLLAVSVAKESRLSKVLDIVARDEYDKAVNEITTYKDKIKEDEYKLNGFAHTQQQTQEDIGHLKEDFTSNNLKDLSDKQKQITDLSAKLKEDSFKNAKQLIVSPVDGYVDTIFIHTVGGVVTPAEKLIAVVPANMPLLVQATLSSHDIGFVRAGMPVAIKVDTFEFQKYGMFDGKVKLVSHDSREDDKLGTVYDVYVQPTTRYIVVEGRKQYLSPGMSVVSEVKVGKRRIIEFFIYPLVKYLNEGMSVR